MIETIYARFTDVRASRFRVMTRILKDGNTLYVEKRSAPGADASAHLEHTARMRASLANLYGGRIAVCPCEYEPDRLTFPFIDGRSYQEELNAAVLSENAEAAAGALADMVQILEASPANIVPFAKTDAFCEVFGDIDVPDGVPALAIANLDATGDNLIRTGDSGLTLIDYEWAFDIPIPRDYVIYRNMLIMYQQHWKNAVRFSWLLEACHVHMDMTLLKALNDRFTQYTCVDPGGVPSPANLLVKNRRAVAENGRPFRRKPHFVYFDTGAGFGEQEKLELASQSGPIDIMLDVHGARAIRFDPFGGQRTLARNLQFTTDGGCLSCEPAVSEPGPDGSTLLRVPANIRVNVPEGTDKVHITGNLVYVPDPRELQPISDVLRNADDEACNRGGAYLTIQAERNDLAARNETLASANRALEERNAELEAERNRLSTLLQEIQNTRSWRYTQWVRDLHGKVRKQ